MTLESFLFCTTKFSKPGQLATFLKVSCTLDFLGFSVVWEIKDEVSVDHPELIHVAFICLLKLFIPLYSSFQLTEHPLHWRLRRCRTEDHWLWLCTHHQQQPASEDPLLLTPLRRSWGTQEGVRAGRGVRCFVRRLELGSYPGEYQVSGPCWG